MSSAGGARAWVTYCRVSTDDQVKEGVSLDAQRAACAHAAAAAQHQIGEDIVDPGFSAKDLKRPGMAKLLELVKAAAIDGVIVYKLDRLTRSVRDLLDLLDIFDKHGVALLSVSENLDTSNPMGRFFIGLIGLIAQWERETIAERVTVGMRHRLSQGGFVGGRIPAGLQVTGEPGKRVLGKHPTTGDRIAQIWPMIAAGKTLRDVANYLNKHQVPCQGQPGWAITSIHRMALNERYIGILVTEADHAAALAAMGQRSCPRRPRKADDVRPAPASRSTRIWMLSGIARCSHCGSGLFGVSTVKPNGTMYYWYRCNGRVRRGKSFCPMSDLSADRWEPAVVEALQRLVAKDGMLEPKLLEVKQALERTTQPLNDERQRLVLERDRIRAEVARLVDLAAAGAVVGSAVAKGLSERQGQIQALDGRIGAAEGRLSIATMTSLQVEAILDRLRQGISHLVDSPIETQAAAVRLLVRSAVLTPHKSDKNRGKVDLSIDLPSLVGGEFVSPSSLVLPTGVEPVSPE